MARSSSGSIFAFILAAAVVMVGGVAIGYFLLGGPHAASNNGVAPAPLPAPAPTDKMASAPPLSPRSKDSNYTAPGYRIQIVEDRVPTLQDKARAARRIADAVARKEARDDALAAAPPPADTSPSDTTTDTAPPSDTTITPSGDTDFEHVTPGNDTTSGQGSDTGGRAQFRVQTGSFQAMRNAQILADALRARGYVASARAVREDGKTVYKVQVGAYRTKSAAAKIALELQQSGYPAYVSPI